MQTSSSWWCTLSSNGMLWKSEAIQILSSELINIMHVTIFLLHEKLSAQCSSVLPGSVLWHCAPQPTIYHFRLEVSARPFPFCLASAALRHCGCALSVSSFVSVLAFSAADEWVSHLISWPEAHSLYGAQKRRHLGPANLTYIHPLYPVL